MRWARFALALSSLLGLASCTSARREPEADVTLVLAAYSASRDAFERAILPAFQAQHEARTGKRLRVRASYLASGAQSRAVASGFPADVVVLALAPDVTRLEKEKLITHDWRKRGRRGAFTTSVVALAVRPGNPKGITGFSDLARPGLDVLMPNPKTSGGAMWNVSALWASALRGHAGVAANDEGAAEGYLRGVLKNVAIADKGARESLITFEKGVGDVAVTYESEVFAGRAAGRTYDMVIPSSTMVVEVMAAVVDVNAQKHALLPEAEAFVDYLSSNEAQHMLATYGFRSDDPEVRAAHAAVFPEVEDPVRIDSLGGWSEVVPKLFGKDGVFPRTWESVYAAP
ncbi:sulfate ABC transporter substrate-binding protein [Polyangium sp. 15x6]|uniref:sulfate ABC transporter substrate-binding protein n=1 Tax=Polyangium sp. 15x6 TaxID=3042687 RepID=UPI00249B94C9|nr:sulfate ABC transporter substrate-binding protein [Polyangium sp. 15x6]MDI3284911.1 sulfate ABC transporter substrate-binding protein [Polyangium sp. 15x6]